MSDRKVSIIIPLYNAGNYLYKCLDSIVGQTYINWECIIVDDYSTDNSYSIAKQYAARDSRFRLYANETNMGCGLTRRQCIALATGEWFAFVDADDYIDCDFIETMLDACLRTKSDISICGTYNRDANYGYMGQDLAEKEYEVAKAELYQQYMLSSWILQYNGNKFYARRVIEAVEYAPLRFCEDSATTYKWLWEANKAVVIPRSMYHYVHHEDSNSQHGNTPLRKAIDTCICIYDHYRFCKAQGFNYMNERLRTFIAPFIAEAIRGLDTNSPEFSFIDNMKNEIF